MPSTIRKFNLFRIKHTTLLEGKLFLRNKHKIIIFEMKRIFLGRKENTIRVKKNCHEICGSELNLDCRTSLFKLTHTT